MKVCRHLFLHGPFVVAYVFWVIPEENYRRSCPLQRSTVFVVLRGVGQNYHEVFLADGEVYCIRYVVTLCSCVLFLLLS